MMMKRMMAIQQRVVNNQNKTNKTKSTTTKTTTVE